MDIALRRAEDNRVSSESFRHRAEAPPENLFPGKSAGRRPGHSISQKRHVKPKATMFSLKVDFISTGCPVMSVPDSFTLFLRA